MKFDLYTKFILTVIAIGVFIPMLANPPVTNKANAFVGGGEMIVAPSRQSVVHLNDGKVRWCSLNPDGGMKCGRWSNK